MNKDSTPALAPQSRTRGEWRRKLLASGVTCCAALLTPRLVRADDSGQLRFRQVPVQYIAALAAPDATHGDNAQQWGLWRKDPGPRGVQLDDFDKLKANGNVAPAQWTFDDSGWWLEEHGLIMEAPAFPLPAGHYLVTGNRSTSAMLTVEAPGPDGSQRWSLNNDATVYDVTHLRCRSALYTPASAGSCSPASARQADFPVRPGADMPPVAGCDKQDYMVFIVYAIAEEDVTG